MRQDTSSNLSSERATFSGGAEWLRVDFHLHTKADREFHYQSQDESYYSAYVNALKKADIQLGVVTNHNKFDFEEFKALRSTAKKKGIKPLATIRQDHLGTSGDGADWISFKAEVSFIKKDKEGGAWYTACPNAGEPCQNRYKATPTTDGQYHCEKCGNYYPNCTRRWIFSALLEDQSSSSWVNFFNEQAEVLLGGSTADDVYTDVFANPNLQCSRQKR